jgi:hypothetical protein
VDGGWKGVVGGLDPRLVMVRDVHGAYSPGFETEGLSASASASLRAVCRGGLEVSRKRPGGEMLEVRKHATC